MKWIPTWRFLFLLIMVRGSHFSISKSKEDYSSEEKSALKDGENSKNQEEPRSSRSKNATGRSLGGLNYNTDFIDYKLAQQSLPFELPNPEDLQGRGYKNVKPAENTVRMVHDILLRKMGYWRPAKRKVCPGSYHKVAHTCLFFQCPMKEYLDWHEARAFCANFGGDLVSFESKDQLDQTRAFLIKHDPWRQCSYFVGGSDEKFEGRWLWVDGKEMPMGKSLWGEIETSSGSIVEPSGGYRENYAFLYKGSNYSLHDVSSIAAPKYNTVPLCQLNPQRYLDVSDHYKYHDAFLKKFHSRYNSDYPTYFSPTMGGKGGTYTLKEKHHSKIKPQYHDSKLHRPYRKPDTYVYQHGPHTYGTHHNFYMPHPQAKQSKFASFLLSKLTDYVKYLHHGGNKTNDFSYGPGPGHDYFHNDPYGPWNVYFPHHGKKKYNNSHGHQNTYRPSHFHHGSPHTHITIHNSHGHHNHSYDNFPYNSHESHENPHTHIIIHDKKKHVGENSHIRDKYDYSISSPYHEYSKRPPTIQPYPQHGSSTGYHDNNPRPFSGGHYGNQRPRPQTDHHLHRPNHSTYKPKNPIQHAYQHSTPEHWHKRPIPHGNQYENIPNSHVTVHKDKPHGHIPSYQGHIPTPSYQSEHRPLHYYQSNPISPSNPLNPEDRYVGLKPGSHKYPKAHGEHIYHEHSAGYSDPSETYYNNPTTQYIQRPHNGYYNTQNHDSYRPVDRPYYHSNKYEHHHDQNYQVNPPDPWANVYDRHKEPPPWWEGQSSKWKVDPRLQKNVLKNKQQLYEARKFR